MFRAKKRFSARQDLHIAIIVSNTVIDNLKKRQNFYVNGLAFTKIQGFSCIMLSQYKRT